MNQSNSSNAIDKARKMLKIEEKFELLKAHLATAHEDCRRKVESRSIGPCADDSRTIKDLIALMDQPNSIKHFRFRTPPVDTRVMRELLAWCVASSNNSGLNPFETLSDELIEKIFAYCDGFKILQLSTICKQFNEVIIASGKLMQKITFDTTLKPLRRRKFEEIPDRLKSRNYKKLRLAAIRQPIDMICVSKTTQRDGTHPTFWTMKFHDALLNLSLTELRIENCTLTRRNFCALMRIVLPTLKTLLLTVVTITDTGGKPAAIATEPLLESLTLDRSSFAVLPYFTNCSKLTHFKFHLGNSSNEQFQRALDCITYFLRKTRNLKHLDLWFANKDFTVIDLDSWNFQLESLRLSSTAKWTGLNDFLMRHPGIKSLLIRHTYEADLALPDLMRTICQMKNVKELWFNSNRSVALEDLEGLENHSVEILRCFEKKVFGRNLKMFRNLRRIIVGNAYSTDKTQGFFELHNIQHGLLRTISLAEYLPIKFIYATFEYPTDAAAFELDVTRFLFEYSKFITKVQIGNINWTNAVNFSLSLDFCTFLSKLPNLNQLSLSQVSDRPLVEELFKNNFDEATFQNFRFNL